MLEFPVTVDWAGGRLDKFLRHVLPRVPASHVFKLIRVKKVRINDARGKPDSLLADGDVVRVRGTEASLLPPAAAVPRERIPIGAWAKPTVLYEDDWLLALDKPSGMAVHPGSGITGATMVDVVRHYLGAKASRNGFVASPAHRLDRDTSGVVLVAKRRRAMVRLTELFTTRRVKKNYVALVKEPLLKPRGVVELALAQHEQSRASREKRGTNFQPATTRWQVIDQTEQLALVRCVIETGRTHQIRRHFAAIGHPLAGDRKHGDFHFNRRMKAEVGLARLFLHASHLEISHPETGDTVALDAPLPPELISVLVRARLQLPATASHDARVL